MRPEHLFFPGILGQYLIRIDRGNLACRQTLHHQAIGNSHALLLIIVPVQLNPKGLDDLAPAGEMEGLGIRQDPIEIEQQRIPTQIDGFQRSLLTL